MLFSNDSFRVVAYATASSTESGRPPAFFTPIGLKESQAVDVNAAA